MAGSASGATGGHRAYADASHGAEHGSGGGIPRRAADVDNASVAGTSYGGARRAEGGSSSDEG